MRRGDWTKLYHLLQSVSCFPFLLLPYKSEFIFFFGRHSQNQKNTKKQQNSIKSLCTPFETKNIDICPFRRLAEKQANNVTIELEPR